LNTIESELSIVKNKHELQGNGRREATGFFE